MKRTILTVARALTILTLAATWAACGKNTAPTSRPADQPDLDPNAVGPFAVMGRTIVLDSASHLRMSWPGVALGTHFSGTGVQVTLRDVNNIYNGQTEDSYWDVSVDGKLNGEPLHPNLKAENYVLAKDLPEGEHTVWITKRTEAMLGASEFWGFSLVDSGKGGGKFLDPPPTPARHIEVIGSSVETGYGVGSTHCNGYQGMHQDQSRAWPQLMANQLNAELMNTSASGKGIVSNIYPPADPNIHMPDVYVQSDLLDFYTTWDFSKWKADAVLIDMGPNDWNGLQRAPDARAFTDAFVALIERVQSNYPGVRVYVLLNSTTTEPARADLRALCKGVVAAVADQAVKFVELPAYTGSDYACDNHPLPAVQQDMAKTLAMQVQVDLGW